MGIPAWLEQARPDCGRPRRRPGYWLRKSRSTARTRAVQVRRSARLADCVNFVEISRCLTHPLGSAPRAPTCATARAVAPVPGARIRRPRHAVGARDPSPVRHALRQIASPRETLAVPPAHRPRRQGSFVSPVASSESAQAPRAPSTFAIFPVGCSGGHRWQRRVSVLAQYGRSVGHVDQQTHTQCSSSGVATQVAPHAARPPFTPRARLDAAGVERLLAR